MNVRCGSCRTQFEVAGAGRYACPVCGAVNVVRQANGPTEGPSTVGGYPAAPGVPGQSAPPPPPPPPPPTPKVRCPECSHEFFVGQVATVTCPNCGSDVDTGLETSGEEGD
jgi:LSD1 subclass zinc finger protein